MKIFYILATIALLFLPLVGFAIGLAIRQNKLGH